MNMSPDTGLVVWTWLTFTGLLAVLVRFAFKPLRRSIEEREAAIRSSLEEARKAREEAQRMAALSGEEMARAREEVGRLINEGRRISDEIKAKASDQARQEASVLVEEARVEIDRETRKSLEGLRSVVANLAVRVSRQVIGETMDEKRHEKLADEFVERLRKSRDEHK